MEELKNKILPKFPTDKDYEKASDDYLRDALKRTYTERFQFATTLYKVQMTMKKATVVHKKMH